MTELETFKAMLIRAGVIYTEMHRPSDPHISWAHLVDTTINIMQNHDSDANVGYSCFYTDMFWDRDGRLLGIGAWE